MSKAYVIGLDYGSDSVRSVLVDAANGEELSSAVFYYPRWNSGKFCDPMTNQFRQHPLDYIEGLESTIKSCLEKVGNPDIAKAVKAISVDSTGSTPVAVDERGVPLALSERFADNPNAMFVLWKDHTAVKEAQEINDHAKKYDPDYLKYVGGIYSSEWFWAKLLHVLRKDQEVRDALYTWVEHCDYIPFLLTGGTHAQDIKRSVCAAGHKSLWAADFGGLPPNQFFAELDPVLDGLVDRLFTHTYTSAQSAGTLSEEWANRLGLSTDVVVGVGAFDCHMGAVGGQIEPYYLSKVMGTSTCDMLVAPPDEVGDTLVRGICGQVDGSIIPGMIGMEAGQSAFGDAYAWFKQVLSWPVTNLIGQCDDISAEDKAKIANLIDTQLIPELSKKAAELPVTESSELAIDWFNGRRTPDADQTLKGALSGLHLGTDAVRIFRSIVEATCFGAKSIADRFVEQGIPVKGLIGLGGVAKKSAYIMQTMADVMNMPIRIHKSEQTCALGAAMFAATAAGLYPKVEDAMEAMGQGFEKTYEPRAEMVAIYAKRYEQYKQLGAFIEQN
ncbi:ribulokinase [Sphingobacterium faecium]|uniref:ribulokinase n=1 Tax=Sphingobacterium faecium TaxID=34087 RepID=UPI00097EAA8B|nr:ribulokinase [Sphingobacterium faecium]UXD70926.1 ribulokinase [Sphingobacterium faecium]SJN43896.1 Ribulokinase [Sphingobacterium faecium PCAi_F2.5]